MTKRIIAIFPITCDHDLVRNSACVAWEMADGSFRTNEVVSVDNLGLPYYANEETQEFRGRGVPAKEHRTARNAIAHAKMMAGWG